ncbi:MAG: LicD family protein [Ruminococcaceae bacterium]|nr:LicD family protein [Oscillospiraceae bacterium]
MKREELHDILYGILCAIDDACRKENIPYFLAGGTMLGAIRHQGFIPWDDDVDISVWRDYYPAMKEALIKHLPPHMRLVEPEDLSPNFYDFIARVQDTRYHWHEPTEEDIKYDNKQNYICVDIFTSIDCSDSEFGIKMYALKQKILYGMAMGHRADIDYSKYSFMQKLQAGILSTIGKMFRMDTILKWHRKLSAPKGKKYTYSFCVDTLPGEMGILNRCEWFRETVDKPFRDRMFPVPAMYHEKLTANYGDYMQPPKDKNAYVQHMTFED